MSAIKRLWRTVFPSPELKAVLQGINVMLGTTVEGSAPHRFALAVARLTDDLPAKIAQDGTTLIALRISLGALYVETGCGEYHIYRGVLSLQGQLFKATFDALIHQAIKDGDMPVAEAAEWIVNMKNGIATAG